MRGGTISSPHIRASRPRGAHKCEKIAWHLANLRYLKSNIEQLSTTPAGFRKNPGLATLVKSTSCSKITAGSACSVACASGSYGDYATYTCTSDKGVGTWSGTAPTCTSGTKPFVAPNILLIQPDDMYQGYSAGWEAPSDPGFSLPVADAGLTTNIDKIGAEGAVFTRAYTASGMCSPSRMALLTGRYASRGAYEIEVSGGSAKTAKVTVPNSKMHGNDLTHNLPQALKLAGYKTGHIGKW